VPAVVKAGPSYAYQLVGHHMLGRVVKSWQHPQPFYFYVNEGAANFLPWLPLAVPAAVRAWRRRRDEPVSAMLLWWFVLGFAAFSAVSGKRIAYILPLVPPFALLVARGAEALLVAAEKPERRTAAVLFTVHLVLAGVGLALAGFGLLGARLGLRVSEALRPVAQLPGGAAVAAGGLVVAAIAVAGARLVRRRRFSASLGCLVASMVAGFLLADAALVPRIDTYRSPRPVAEQMDALVPPGQGEAGIYPAVPPGTRGEGEYAYAGAFNIYSSRLYLTPLRDAEEVRRFLASPGRRIVVAGAKSADGLGALPPGVHRSAAGAMVLLTNFPTP
jgi:4-amino-4-deoxy-L-arabinose transferase-like glycosyltransferase